MGDVMPSFADQAKQLLADFQHAMDTNAPVSPVMMTDLKAFLDIGVSAHADCEALHIVARSAEVKAAALQAEATDLVATIHGGN
jgi:hypothetical protein